MLKKFKLNADLKRFKKGTTIYLEVDRNGQPINRYWAARFDDAKKDNCISYYEEEKKGKELKTKSK